MHHYLQKKILEENPFAVLDVAAVGGAAESWVGQPNRNSTLEFAVSTGVNPSPSPSATKQVWTMSAAHPLGCPLPD